MFELKKQMNIEFIKNNTIDKIYALDLDIFYVGL